MRKRNAKITQERNAKTARKRNIKITRRRNVKTTRKRNAKTTREKNAETTRRRNKKNNFFYFIDLKLFTIDDKLIKIFFSFVNHAEKDVFIIINLNHVRKFKINENEIR